VFGPLKACYNAAAVSGIIRNSGAPTAIYQVAAHTREFDTRALSPANITEGFKTTLFIQSAYIMQK
jgi:hypothetical protein